MLDPLIYVHSNVRATTLLLMLSHEFKVKNFVFASSSSVYGKNEKVFSHSLSLCNPCLQTLLADLSLTLSLRLVLISFCIRSLLLRKMLLFLQYRPTLQRSEAASYWHRASIHFTNFQSQLFGFSRFMAQGRVSTAAFGACSPIHSCIKRYNLKNHKRTPACPSRS